MVRENTIFSPTTSRLKATLSEFASVLKIFVNEISFYSYPREKQSFPYRVVSFIYNQNMDLSSASQPS